MDRFDEIARLTECIPGDVLAGAIRDFLVMLRDPRRRGILADIVGKMASNPDEFISFVYKSISGELKDEELDGLTRKELRDAGLFHVNLLRECAQFALSVAIKDPARRRP